MRSPTTDGLRLLVAEQLGFLRVSVGGFLDGHQAEALRVAVAIRVLVHKTSRSRPLLEQLDREYLTMPVPDQSTLMPGFRDAARDGRIAASMAFPVQTGGPVTEFLVDYPTVSLAEWWSEIPVLIAADDGGPHQFTRKDLVLTLANRQGGAHVDPEGVPENYARLIIDRPIRVVGHYSDTLDLARWTVAKSGAEIGQALLRRYPELATMP